MSTPFAGSTAITNQCPVRGRLCRGPRLAPPPPTMSNNAGGLLGVHAPFPACATGRDFGLPCGAAFAPPPPPPANNAGGLLDVGTPRTPPPGVATLPPGRGHVWCPPNSSFIQQRWWPPGRGYLPHTSSRARDFVSQAGPRLVPP